ncbi:MAG: hypothetical protein HY282_08890 [Nitrospirae bacterium]|nr:hypothetical protein [Candidatus Manganitrophaceae bacterium]
MKKEIFGTILVLAITAPVFYAGPSTAAMLDAPGHREVSATVKKVDGTLVSVRTDEGTTRYFTVREAEKSGLPSIDRGDTVVLQMDEGNQIIDIHGSHHHRSLTAMVETYRGSDKVLTVRTEDGATQSFELKDPVVPKVVILKEGAQISFEVDEQNRVMDLHPIQS